MNPRLGRPRASFGIAADDFFKLGRRRVAQACLNRLGLTRWQTAELQNAVAVACGAVAVCAFAARNGFLSAAQFDAAWSELDVDDFIYASLLLSIPTVLLAQRYHGPMWSSRSTEDDEPDSMA